MKGLMPKAPNSPGHINSVDTHTSSHTRANMSSPKSKYLLSDKYGQTFEYLISSLAYINEYHTCEPLNLQYILI